MIFSCSPSSQRHSIYICFISLNSGQPKRHLLTTGWSLFVSGKRLFAGDSVLFIRYFLRFECFLKETITGILHVFIYLYPGDSSGLISLGKSTIRTY